MEKDILLEIAKTYGTPLYVFDLDTFSKRVEKVYEAFSADVQLCYSIKANSFLTGSLPHHFSHLEVCSPGELNICKSLGIDPMKIIFSGVNKTEKCIDDAIRYGTGILTAESTKHLDLINNIAGKHNVCVRVLLRLTGGDQFGMDESVIREIIRTISSLKNVDIIGLHYFSGTQKRNASIIKRELAYISDFADELLSDFGFNVQHLEYGPGLFADYYGENPNESELRLLTDIAPYIQSSSKRFKMAIEMGRFFASSCGSYLTSVADIKTNHGKKYAIVDGGSHQTGYDGLMLSSKPPHIRVLYDTNDETTPWTICGSLCSRGDILARDVLLPALRIGDILLFEQTGAYAVTEGMSLFLSRDLPAVLLWSSYSGAKLIRKGIDTYTLNLPQQ